MKQVVFDAPGGPEVLSLREVPIPDPKPGEVLVRVVGAGVNRPDILQRSGLYPPPPGASPHLGLEVSGYVEQVSDASSGFKVGQAVCALVSGGGYAEYLCIPAQQLMRVPKGLSVLHAAALPETCMTVWSNVFERCALAPHETFLVHAGASSIGLTAIAMAKAHGATVAATVSNQEKALACVQAGADHVFFYTESDWAQKIAVDLPNIDVILDFVAGSNLDKNLNLLAVEGRLCIIAQLSGRVAELDMGKLMMRRLTVTGSTLRARSAAYKVHLSLVLQERVWPLVEAGLFTPCVHQVFPFEQVRQAHEVLESRANIGKVLLSFADEKECS
ncbi:MAG: NAD(P)H-quinone oxidoreductase [Burkholderiales bacterium]|jgi:putative PIG3 family NAD(P)H quinone oxidoreductase|nr:NAD(P)H-quinone oxidoreductase [Burkholderiales bacterium]